jgi:hypothetical protein
MPKKRGKSDRELKRKKSSRRPRKIVLIVVEGQETEYNYFSELKEYLQLLTTNIKVVSGYGGSCIDTAVCSAMRYIVDPPRIPVQ